MKRSVVAVALLLSLVAVGCGGSSTSTPVVSPTLTLGALATFDGFIFNPGTVNTASNVIVCGDETNNASGRFFMAFDISSLPVTAVVDSATVTAMQVAIFGTPYTDLGTVRLELVNLGGTLDTTDFASPPIPSGPLPVLSTTAVLEAKQVSVTGLLATARTMGLPRLDLRASFAAATDSNADADVAQFGDVESGNAATLFIVYH